jgi:hypothetical protein
VTLSVLNLAAHAAFYEALKQQAAALRAARDDGSYTDGDERALAHRAVAVLDAADRPDALRFLVHDQATTFLLSDCDLDEFAEPTHRLAEQIGGLVFDALKVKRQTLLPTLRTWATRYVLEQANTLALLAATGVAPD